MVQRSRSQPSSGAFALAGPGRAGTTLAVALAARGWTPVAVAGRRVDAPSTVAASARLGVPAVGVVVDGTTRNGPGIGVVAETVVLGTEFHPARSAVTV